MPALRRTSSLSFSSLCSSASFKNTCRTESATADVGLTEKRDGARLGENDKEDGLVPTLGKVVNRKGAHRDVRGPCFLLVTAEEAVVQR